MSQNIDLANYMEKVDQFDKKLTTLEKSISSQNSEQNTELDECLNQIKSLNKDLSNLKETSSRAVCLFFSLSIFSLHNMAWFYQTQNASDSDYGYP